DQHRTLRGHQKVGRNRRWPELVRGAIFSSHALTRRCASYPMTWKLAKKNTAANTRTSNRIMRQGIAPWRGRGDGLTLDCFFLMRGAAIRSIHYRSEGSRQLSLEAQASDSYSNGEAVSTVILLFFEQAVKCGASIVSIARCGTRVRDDRSLGRRSHSYPVSCDSNPRSKELTVVRLILYRDSHRDGFQTLEAGGRIEVYTLLAAMKRHAAFGTYAFVVK